MKQAFGLFLTAVCLALGGGGSEIIEPGPGEARLKVAYRGVCGTEMHIFHGATLPVDGGWMGK
jgi:threonine dehydrogenase-like Zn-dependent dehydrogenase